MSRTLMAPNFNVSRIIQEITPTICAQAFKFRHKTGSLLLIKPIMKN
jgi:hypothetical protein